MQKFVSRATLVFLILIGLLIGNTSSIAKAQSDGDLLSYAELMKLPQAKRVEYIQGVRAILVELSKNPDARFSDSDPRSRSKLKVWLEFLDAELLQTAKAESNLCVSNKFCESAMRSCFDQGQGIIWQEAIGTYKCNPAEKIDTKVQSGSSAVFAKVSEQAFAQYAARLSDPRQKSQGNGGADATIAAPPVAIRVISPSGGNVTDARPAISIVRPPALTSGTASLLQSIGVQTGGSQRLPGSQARNIQEYVELLAKGKIKGKRYSCRSKHQTSTFTNDSGEAIDHSTLRECTNEEEERIQALYDRVSSSKISFSANLSAPPSDREPTAAPPASSSPVPAVTVAPPTVAAAAGDVGSPPADVEIQVAQARPVAPPAPMISMFGRKILREEFQKILDEKKSPDVLCESERKTLGDGKLVFVPMDKDASFGRCMTDENAKAFARGEIQRHPSDPEPASAVAPSVVPLANSKFSSCAPKPEACGDRDAIRKEYYQGKLPCVFAGMISNLDNQNRRCQAVTEFKLGDESLKCEHGQAMCNPLLFGSVLGSSPVKAICVGRGQDVTSQCSKLSNARDAELFINRNMNGLQDKWDEFRTNLATVCKPQSVSAKFHCHECNVMKQRLFELHARLVSNPCETDLDKGIKNRIHIRSRATKK